MFAFMNKEIGIDVGAGIATWDNGVMVEVPTVNHNGSVEGYSFDVAIEETDSGFVQTIMGMKYDDGRSLDMVETWNTASIATSPYDGLWHNVKDAFNANVNSPDGIKGFIDTLENLPSEPKFRAMIDLVTEVGSLVSGAQGVTALLGIGNENKGTPEKVAEIGFTTAAVAKAMGLDPGVIASLFSGRLSSAAPNANSPGNPNGLGVDGIVKLTTAAGFAAALATGLHGAFSRSNPMPVLLVRDDSGNSSNAQ